MHTSIMMNTPCEIINLTPVNPLISKCQIKVCYVGDEPNRNRSILTKEVARELANSLPGSPIVGKFNHAIGDFEEHNRTIQIVDGKFLLKGDTMPYGFVDLGAKAWFQKFLDDGVEHEYLMTEGYVWTGRYPEVQRVITKGNGQSMELDENIIDAYWTKDDNGKPQFFIINEAIISALCILGEDVEPCFEGASITKVQFSFEDGFKEQLFSMMNTMKEILEKGGESVVTNYAVEIGDALWSTVYDFLVEHYPDDNDKYMSKYRLDGIYEENGQKFLILLDRNNGATYFRLDFELSEENGFVPAEELVAVEKVFEPVFAPEAVAAYEANYSAAKAEAEVDEPAVDPEPEPEPEADPEPTEPESDPVAEPQIEDPAPAAYILEEIPEYVELQTSYTELQTSYSVLNEEITRLNDELTTLREFRANIERQNKEAMINSFYMLSDADKADVIEHINDYSIEDIEAKLSIICVRNRVNFNLDDDNGTDGSAPITYNLNSDAMEDDAVPAWIKAVKSVAKNMK